MRIPYTPPTHADFLAAIARHQAWVKERLGDPAVQAEVEKARAEAAAVARMLREKYGATRVRLFGSLARLDQVEGFDIDIAAEGLRPTEYFDAWREARDLVSRKLDLIDMNDTYPDLFKRRIDEDGVDLP